MSEPTNEAEFRLEFQKQKSYLNKIIGSWSKRVAQAEKARLQREVDIDPSDLRKSGEIGPDETFIPDRTIENNIRREQPAAITYLVQSRRLAIFECMTDRGMDCQNLELEFTRGMRYPGWIRSWFKCDDGSRLHGSDSVEVVFDEDKPLHVAVEHVGYDKLFYAEGVGPNIQDAPELILPKKVTTLKLKSWVNQYGFDPNQVQRILDTLGDSRRDEIITIYKEYFKADGIVYVAWFCTEYSVDDWLKVPEPLTMGVSEEQEVTVVDPISGVPMVDPFTGIPQTRVEWVPVYMRDYPVFVLPYRETEQEEISKHRGRAFYDFPQQEAKTAVQSGYVNRVMKSGHLYVAPMNQSDGGNVVDRIQQWMEDGSFFGEPVQFFSPDPPDPSIIKGLQYFDTKNTENTGQIAAAVSNRQDSRKTATEIQAAEKETAMLSGVPLVLFSSFVSEVLNFCWKIVQSQAVQGKIPFVQRMEKMLDGTMSSKNDLTILSHEYILKPAGDVDVIQRAETEQKMQQDWPVIQTTGAAMKFLADLVVLRYPDKGTEYAQMIIQGDQKKQVIQSLAGMVQSLISPEELKTMAPEMQQKFQAIQQQVQQVLSQP